MAKKKSGQRPPKSQSKAATSPPAASSVEERLADTIAREAAVEAAFASPHAELRRLQWLSLLEKESAADSRYWPPKKREKRTAFLIGLVRAGSDSDSDETSKMLATKAREILVETVDRAAWHPEGPAYYVVAPLPETDEAPDALLGVTYGLKGLAAALALFARQTPRTPDPVKGDRIIESIIAVRDELRDLAPRIPADLRERISAMLGDALEAVGRGATDATRGLARELAERFRGMAVRVEAEASAPVAVGTTVPVVEERAGTAKASEAAGDSETADAGKSDGAATKIPLEYLTILMTKQQAADLHCRGVAKNATTYWRSRIKNGEVRPPIKVGHRWQFDVRDFPADVQDGIRSAPTSR